MNYEECNKIIDYLDKNKLEELRNYEELEKEKYYLNNFKIALKSYSNYINFMYDYIDDKLLITNGAGVFLLNSDKIISSKERDKILLKKTQLTKEKDDFILEKIEVIKNRANLSIKKIKAKGHSYNKHYEITLENDIMHEFNLANFYYIKSFLGDLTNYYMSQDNPECYAKSDIGEGIVLGLKRNGS